MAEEQKKKTQTVEVAKTTIVRDKVYFAGTVIVPEQEAEAIKAEQVAEKEEAAAVASGQKPTKKK